MSHHEVQQKHLEILVRNGGFQFTDSFFPYTSGQIGPYYVQSAVVMNNGNDYAAAVKDMADLVSETISPQSEKQWILSGGETRDWIFSLPVAFALQLPHLMIYKDGKILGPDIKDQNIAHVADLNNEGSSPRDKWIPAIRSAGGNIKDIFFYVDRLEDGVNVMKELELQSHSLVPLDANAWQYLKQQEVINHEIYQNLMRRMNDKESWATQMLRSEKGFETFVRLLDKSKDKAMKILEHGYPNMEQEITARVKAQANDVYRKQIRNV